MDRRRTGVASRLLALIGGGARGKFARDSALYMSDRLVTAGLNFLTFAAIARQYGPSDMGRWSYALTAVNVMAPLLAGGVEPAVIRALLRTPERRGQILGSAALLVMAATLGSVGLSLVWLWIETGSSDIFWMGAIFALAALPNVVFVIEQDLKASLRAKPVVVAHLVAAGLGAAARLGLALAHVALPLLAASALVEAGAVAAILVAIAVRGGDKPWRWRFTLADVREIGAQALPQALSQLVVSLFFRLNFFMLARLSSFDQVGKFALGFSIVQALGIVPPAVSAAIYPRLLAVAREDGARLIHYVRWTVYAFTLVGFVMAAACALSAPLLPAIFGARYEGTQWVLVILAGTIVFNFSGAARALLINIEAVPRYHVVSALVGLGTVAAASAVLIPAAGAAGAAWVQFAACFVSPYATTLFLPRIRALAGAQFLSLVLVPPHRVRGDTAKSVSPTASCTISPSSV